MVGERPDRDVLAEALSDLVSGRTTGTERGVAWVRYGGFAGDGLTADQALAGPIIVALAARGYTLSKSAPDPEPPRDRIDEANALGYREGYRAAEAAHKVATPPAEPALRSPDWYAGYERGLMEGSARDGG